MNEREQRVLDDTGLSEPWALVRRFASLVRESGSEDERTAAEYIAGRLTALGVPHQVHWPELYLSLPRETSVSWAGGPARRDGPAAAMRAAETRVYAKTPSFSVSTAHEPGGMRRGPAVYIPSVRATSIEDIFAGVGGAVPNLNGCVAVTEGLPMPAKVLAFQQQGAVAAVFVSPGERIHEGI